MNHFFVVLKKYAVFSGRASRSEYWWYMLFYLIVLAALLGVDAIASLFDVTSMFSSLFWIATLIPTIAVTVRRLHDLNMSGWTAMVMFLPILALLVFPFWFARKGTDGANRFGPDPLEKTALLSA
jgi:uncharacterized membrane protein YhaH (DUF805 family)